LAEKRPDEALQVAGEAAALASGDGAADRRGRAAALLQTSGAHLQRREFDRALAAVAEARELLSDLGDQRAEASCWHLAAQAHLARDQYGEALVAAESARAILRQTGDVARETGMLILAADICTYMLIEGARGLSAKSKAFLEGRGRAKVLRVAKEAAGLGRRLGEPALLALALHSLARAHATNKDFEAAFAATGEAMPLFRKVGDVRGEASAALLNANIHMASRRGDLAMVSTKEALQLYRRANDLNGEVEALDLLGRLASSGGPAVPGAGAAGALPGAGADDEAPEAGDAAPSAGASAVAPRSMPAMDIMSLPLHERVKISVTNLVLDAIGRDELEEDRALMETGMTSIASIMLRDRLQDEFPDIEEMDLTFVFDHPTIREMSEFIMEALPDDK